MPFMSPDPRTSLQIVREDLRTRAERRARRWVLRELDRLSTDRQHHATGSIERRHGS